MGRSPGELAKFPVLNRIESLTALVDNDENCSARRTTAGCGGFRLVPRRIGDDINDLLRRGIAS